MAPVDRSDDVPGGAKARSRNGGRARRGEPIDPRREAVPSRTRESTVPGEPLLAGSAGSFRRSRPVAPPPIDPLLAAVPSAPPVPDAVDDRPGEPVVPQARRAGSTAAPEARPVEPTPVPERARAVPVSDAPPAEAPGPRPAEPAARRADPTPAPRTRPVGDATPTPGSRPADDAAPKARTGPVDAPAPVTAPPGAGPTEARPARPASPPAETPSAAPAAVEPTDVAAAPVDRSGAGEPAASVGAPARPAGDTTIVPAVDVVETAPVAREAAPAVLPSEAPTEVGPARGSGPRPVPLPAVPVAPPLGSAPTVTVASRRRLRWRGRRPRVRKVSRVVRRVDAWTVLKLSVIFYAVMFVVLLVAGVLLWNLASTTGTIDNVEGFIADLFVLESFEFDGERIFRASWVLGLFLVAAGTGFNVTMAVLFNLIADLVGGLRVTVLEEEVVLRDRPVPAASPARRRKGG